jgi:hypothetical protein
MRSLAHHLAECLPKRRLHRKRLGGFPIVRHPGELGLPDCMPVLCQLSRRLGGGLGAGVGGVRHVGCASDPGRCAAPL